MTISGKSRSKPKILACDREGPQSHRRNPIHILYPFPMILFRTNKHLPISHYLFIVTSSKVAKLFILCIIRLESLNTSFY